MTRLYRLICYRWPELVGLVFFAGLALNIWMRSGTKPFLILLAVIVAGASLAGLIVWLTGSLVVGHSRREQRQIRSGNHPMREITK